MLIETVLYQSPYDRGINIQVKIYDMITYDEHCEKERASFLVIVSHFYPPESSVIKKGLTVV